MTNTLRVLCVEARDLPRADILGKTDGYLELRLLSRQSCSSVQKTRVIPNNLNPVWNQDFTFSVSSPHEDRLEVKLYDYDTFTNNDLMGVVEIPVSSVTSSPGGVLNQWWDLYNPKDRRIRVKGRLNLSLTYSGFGVSHPSPQVLPPPGSFSSYPTPPGYAYGVPSPYGPPQPQQQYGGYPGYVPGYPPPPQGPYPGYAPPPQFGVPQYGPPQPQPGMAPPGQPYWAPPPQQGMYPPPPQQNMAYPGAATAWNPQGMAPPPGQPRYY